jgi:hypothetical protein
VVAQLAPSLDPFALASRFLVNNTRRQVFKSLDPQRLYYSSQKLMLRASRIVEALERASGARPGAGVQVSVSGTQRLEETVDRAGRRVAIVLGGGMLVLAAAAWLAPREQRLRVLSAAAARAPADTRPRPSTRPTRRVRLLSRPARAS